MNKQDLLNSLRGVGGELLSRAKLVGESAVRAGAKSAAGRSTSPRSMADLVQKAVITLLVLVCFFCAIFASCAKTEAETPEQDTAVTQRSEDPSVTPSP